MYQSSKYSLLMSASKIYSPRDLKNSRVQITTRTKVRLRCSLIKLPKMLKLAQIRIFSALHDYSIVRRNSPQTQTQPILQSRAKNRQTPSKLRRTQTTGSVKTLEKIKNTSIVNLETYSFTKSKMKIIQSLAKIGASTHMGTSHLSKTQKTSLRKRTCQSRIF